MEISEVVARLNETYADAVKPAILKQDYDQAFLEMSGIVDSIKAYKELIMSEIHCGRRYVVEARLLLEKIEKKSVENKDIEYFEAFAAQTKLPKNH